MGKNKYRGLVLDPNDPAYKKGWTIIIPPKKKYKKTIKEKNGKD